VRPEKASGRVTADGETARTPDFAWAAKIGLEAIPSKPASQTPRPFAVAHAPLKPPSWLTKPKPPKLEPAAPPPDPPSAGGGIIGKTFGLLTVVSTDATQKSEQQIARLRRAAASATSPPSEQEILKLDLFLRERGEQADTVLDERGALERSAVKQFVLARKERRQ
jgi:hypothetical protein